MHHEHHTASAEIDTSITEFVHLVTSPLDDPAAHEKALMRAVMKLGAAGMKHQLEQLAPSECFVEDGVLWREAVMSRFDVMTMFGAVKVERPLFRSERNGPTRCLVKEQAGLVAGFWSQPAAKIAAVAVSEMPMGRAASFLAEAGIVPASRSSLLRLTGNLHDLWEEHRGEHERIVREAMPIPPQATTVAVSLDGVMVLMSGSNKATLKAAARARGKPDKGPAGYREASVAVVCFYDKDGERLATRRFGRMPQKDKTDTKDWLRAELKHIRTERPDLVVVAIADGAPNNWSFLEELGADHEVVDFFHTAVHLHRHVSKANGPSSVETRAKLKEMRRQLLEESGAADKVFEDMQRGREKAGTAAPPTNIASGKRQPTYFQRHRGRMNYAELRDAKLPIGSGVTESTCKLTVCDRLRRTGMLWTERGGQGVLTLRAHVVSGSFDPAWKELMSANQQRLAA